MILVTGATGTVGREVVAQLVAAGHPVRALVRDASKFASAGHPRQVEVAVGDLLQPETLVKAVEGVERVFSLPVGPQGPTQEGNLARAAKKAGAQQVVSLSVLDAGTGSSNIVAQWHDAGERAIQDTGISWTFVRPGSFMSNALNWVGTIKGQGSIFAAYADGLYPPIHPKDIAAVAVKALTSPGHEGQAYRITGPEALTVSDQARILSEAVGKPIKYVSIPEDAARAGMLQAGMPPPLVGALLDYAKEIRAGHASEVLATVEQVTGHKARTFADWARENAAAFK